MFSFTLTWQALTNQRLSNLRSGTPVLLYLFLNLLPYQNICMCWWSRKYLTCFLKIIVFWVSFSMIMIFLISAWYYACNMLEEVKSTYNVCLTPQHYVFSLCDICPTDVKHLYAAFLVIIYYSFSSLFVFLSKKRLVQDGLVVKALDYQSRGPVFKTTGWLQGWLSLSSFRGW